MIPLIDCDILLYEIGSCGDYINDEGDHIILGFDRVGEMFDQKVKEICEGAMSTKPPLLFLTSSVSLLKMVNKVRKFEGREELPFKPNFRYKLAVTKGYKANREDKKKPYHFNNLVAYICSLPGLRIANGMEADDLMSIYQCNREADIARGMVDTRTIICSRDKDLKMVPGMHYSWECGAQPSWGPDEVDEMGGIELITKVDKKGKKTYKIKGTGLMFFYSQLLTGDGVDNIPGCPGAGPLKAILLTECTNENEMFDQVVTHYEAKLGEQWPIRLIEQGNLLWMRRKLDDVWKFPRPQDKV